MPAYVMTPAEYEAKLNANTWVEPKSDERMSVPLQVLNALNWATNPDARRKQEGTTPDAAARLIVNLAETPGGKPKVQEIYYGRMQQDGSIEVNGLKDTVKHYSRTDSRSVIVQPEGKQVDKDTMDMLRQWRREIEWPKIPQAQQQGYRTGAYDPPLPMGQPQGNAPTRR